MAHPSGYFGFTVTWIRDLHLEPPVYYLPIRILVHSNAGSKRYSA